MQIKKGRKPRKGLHNSTQVIHVKTTPDEALLIFSEAKRLGFKSMSEYVRWASIPRQNAEDLEQICAT